MRIFGPTSLFSNAWSLLDPLFNSPKKFCGLSLLDSFRPSSKQGPETILIIEFHGQKFEILIYGETSPELLETLRIKLTLYAKFFGVDFLKAASAGQGALEPRLRIYLAKNQEHYSEVLEKDIGYAQKEAKEKAQTTAGIFYFEKNAIVIQCDLPNFPDTLTHEIAHYVDDLLKPRSSEIFCAENDMFSAFECDRLTMHYREQRKLLKGPLDFRGFPSRYGAHGDAGKCYVFEWFAESLKFSVDHFENPTPPESPDPWITNDINSLALWTQGKGFATIANWTSPNPLPPTVLSKGLELLQGFSFPPPAPLPVEIKPRLFKPPSVVLRDDFANNDYLDFLERMDGLRLEFFAHDLPFNFYTKTKCDIWQPENFRFYFITPPFTPPSWYPGIDLRVLEIR